MRKHTFILLVFMAGINTSCQTRQTGANEEIRTRLNDYAPVRLTADLSELSDTEKRMLPILMEVADIMDDIFWTEAYGDKQSLLVDLDDSEKALALINYGPWDRLNDNQPFLAGFGMKPPGANFYPQDMTREEFEAFGNLHKESLYTLIRRNEEGDLNVVPYHEAYRDQVERAARLLREASSLSEDTDFAKYLNLRADALLNDNYYESDLAWMDMKENRIDFVVGPIETYEDQLYGYKAAHEAYLLLKDMEWSSRLSRFAVLLPSLQKELPVDDVYKQETPGSNSDLGAYDVIYYAGDCNAGSKTIAINLPNDERVHEARGSRRLQLKNAMQAKFDSILVPIADVLITADHVDHVTFDAFFTNTMFHEVAHGLGSNMTIDGRSTVRDALKELYTTLEEGKADILGLFLVTRLNEMGELDLDLQDAYTTFMAGIFRSVRFGSSSAHGRANLIRFNYFKEHEAFIMNADGQFVVEMEKMKRAMESLSNLILTIQGNGDYERAAWLIETYGQMDDQLTMALDRVEDRDIPVDIVFEQGIEVLGLERSE